MAQDLSAVELLKNGRVTGALEKPLVFDDSLTAVLMPETREFITCPKRTEILRPPAGSTQDLYLREDGFYGEDDPVQYPQPFNSRYLYLACVPSLPISESDDYWDNHCMWKKGYHPSEFSDQNGPSLAELATSVQNLHRRTKALLTKSPTWKRRFVELDITIDLCVHWLSNHRLHRDLRASNDGHHGVERCLSWRLKQSGSCKITYGCIRVEQQGRNATIPSQGTGILSTPSHPVIYTGQAGAKAKFAAIWAASISCFDVPSPFSNMHLEGAYQPSYTVGSGSIISPSNSSPSTSATPSSETKTTENKRNKGKGGKGKPGTQAQVSQDLFLDLPTDHPFTLPPILAWKDVNLAIDKSHPDKQSMMPGDNPRLKTVLPAPGILLRTPNQDRSTHYFLQWAHIREPFLRRSRAGDGNQTPISLRASLWRNVLSMRFRRMYEGPKAVDQQGKLHEEASEWLQCLFTRYAQGTDPVSSSTAMLNDSTEWKLVYELCIANFWYQLESLDELLDSTIPVPSSTLTQSELLVAKAGHRRDRLQLIRAVFGDYDDPFSATSSRNTVAIASNSWATRLPALKALWRLMSSWPGKKDLLWNRGDDQNIENMPAEGFVWEKVLPA
ncbi:hypothetical protein PQX77_017578 [Marasmius sp. AFHP31]|nr:hypothetical protein PQX77_017578 [Marasmius sp. AFHP31]